MFEYSEEEIKEGLQNENGKIIKHIYKKYYGSIKSMVYKFNNLMLDPEEIFQEGMVRVILNIRNDKFKKQGTVFSYLFGICRNICLKELSKMKNYTAIPDDLEDEAESNDEYFETIHQVQSIFSNLDNACQDIINLRFGLNPGISDQEYGENKGLRFDEIGLALNIQADNARQRFRRCLEKLKNLVKDNSELKIVFGQ